MFRADPMGHFKEVKALCAKYGCEGWAPLDNELEVLTASSIFAANKDLIDACDVVLANLTMFRGACVDDGTSWEIGYGYAKGKACYGYIDGHNATDLKMRTESLVRKHDLNMAEFPQVEDFGGPVNLMLTESIKLSGGAICNTVEECLAAIQMRFAAQ